MAVSEHITVLFTDLVGSTELATSLAPGAADELRNRHFSCLRQAIAASGGTEVKNLGDGLMVVFPAASAALGCAVAMQQAVNRDNADAERPLGLRVGMSTGESTKEGEDYFGEPVIEAARLCAQAEGGQILVSDLVRATAGRRSPHPFTSLGELELKGLPEPIETLQVSWEPLEGSNTDTERVVPLPGHLARSPAVGVIGRDAEMQVMEDAIKRVTGAEGRAVLLISGEAGMGKTTLAAAAARSAFDNGACVLFGRCGEDLASPYQLFAESLGHYITHAPEDQLRIHVLDHGSELSRLVPALGSRIRDLPSSRATDADTERYLLFAAVVGLLATASADRPIILVLDDLQWADNGSLLLLRHLAAAEQEMRVLVVGTYRDSELSRSHPLTDTLANLHRQRDVSRIELVGLDDSGVLSYLEAAAGQALDDVGVGLAHAVYRETDGNPFFVSEVLRHLSETGAIYQDASGRWTSDDSLEQMVLPDSVRVVIGARVGRLGQDAERVLSMAAVIGRDFDLDLLAQATKTSEDELLDILDAAAAASLVRELTDAPGHYNFAHSLIQHTLYEDLGPTRRARAHKQVGEALEDLCGDDPGRRVGELARHWVNASQPIDLTKAITYSRQAGDAALAALAPADALSYYSQALDLYPQVTDPDPILALDLAIGLGTAQRQTGDAAFRDTLLGAARRAIDLDDSKRLVAAALANSRGFYSNVGGIDTDKVEVLEKALAELPADSPDRALILATLCSELAYGSSLERRRALADEAIAIAESSADDAIIVRVLNDVFVPLDVPSLNEELETWTARALTQAEGLNDPVLLFWAARSRSVVAESAGDLVELDRCIDAMTSLAEQLNEPTWKWISAYRRAVRAQIAGDCDRVESLANDALRIGTEGGQPDATSFWGAQLVAVNHQRGTMDELVPLIEQLAAQAPSAAGLATAALARAYAETDRITESRDLLERISSAAFDLPLDQLWLTGMVCYAEAAISVGDPKYAQPLLEELTPWAAQLAGYGTTNSGPVSAYLGGLATVLGRYDDAGTYFAQSKTTSDRIGAKFFAARTDLWWGKMLAGRQGPGDEERARELLTKAHSVAATNGYGNIERRAAAALSNLT
jgi:class 3 adenylate cyclase/tetratricopeptide (TPR) repeat protein